MHFPMLLELDGIRCLIVGGGDIAQRKAATLRSFGAEVVLVAPETCGRGFREEDLEGCRLVVAATDDRTLNHRVAALCNARSIPVNVVDDPAVCTFHFPAIARKGPVTVAVGTEGACPTAARMLRDRIAETLLSDGLVEAVTRFGTERESLLREIPDAGERTRRIEGELAPWFG